MAPQFRLAGTLMIFLAVILMPAGDFFRFRLLSLLVRFFQRKRASLRGALLLVFGLLVHQSLLVSVSFAQRQSQIINDLTRTSSHTLFGSQHTAGWSLETLNVQLQPRICRSKAEENSSAGSECQATLVLDTRLTALEEKYPLKHP